MSRNIQEARLWNIKWLARFRRSWSELQSLMFFLFLLFMLNVYIKPYGYDRPKLWCLGVCYPSLPGEAHWGTTAVPGASYPLHLAMNTKLSPQLHLERGLLQRARMTELSIGASVLGAIVIGKRRYLIPRRAGSGSVKKVWRDDESLKVGVRPCGNVIEYASVWYGTIAWW